MRVVVRAHWLKMLDVHNFTDFFLIMDITLDLVPKTVVPKHVADHKIFYLVLGNCVVNLLAVFFG